MLLKIDRFLGTPPLGKGGWAFSVLLLVVLMKAGCLFMAFHMGKYDWEMSVLVPLVAAGFLSCAIVYIIMPYLLLGLGGTGGSVVAFGFLDYDLVSLMYLLPLFLVGCFCLMQAMRYEDKSPIRLSITSVCNGRLRRR